jgi:uncharacterized protein (DUF433 family)
MDPHPLIRLHVGEGGHPRPLVSGTRLYVHQLIRSHIENGGDIEDTADFFGIGPHLVSAALAYYADFKEEVDAHADADNRFAEAERARWLTARSGQCEP